MTSTPIISSFCMELKLFITLIVQLVQNYVTFLSDGEEL